MPGLFKIIKTTASITTNAVANENEGFSKRSERKDFLTDIFFISEPIERRIFTLTFSGVFWNTTFSLTRFLISDLKHFEAEFFLTKKKLI